MKGAIALRPTVPTRLALAVAMLAGSACTYTRAVTQTNVPAVRSHPVEVDVKRYIFFAATDNDEVQQLTRKLQEKCPGGRVLGIMTKDLRTLYVLFFFWSREVVASGFCVKDSANGQAADAAGSPADTVAWEDL